MTEEKQLIELYVSGNNDAIARLYEKYKMELFAYSHFYLKNTSHSAEDVVHSVFETFLAYDIETREKYFGQSESIRSYLFVSIRNRSFDVLKSLSKRTSVIERLKNLVPSSQQPSEDFAIRDTTKALFEYLTPREREILSLHLQGMGNAQIAKQLSISVITCTNIIYNGKKKLRAVLNSTMISLLLIMLVS